MPSRPSLALLAVSHIACLAGCALDWSPKHAGPDAATDSDEGGTDAAISPGAQDDASTEDASTLDSSVPTCEPVPEVCNLVDDSCDGRVDENLWSPLSTASTQVWTGASSTQHTLDWGQVAFAPTSDGGGWLVYSGNNGSFGLSGDTRAAKLDASGAPTGIEVLLGIKGAWSADAHEGRLALLYQTREAYDTQSVYLRVFTVDAAGLSPIGEPTRILENRDPDQTLDNHDLPAFPIGVTLLTDKQGRLHALTLAGSSARSGSETVYPTQLRSASLTQDGKWSLSLPRPLSQQPLFAFPGLSALAARMAPIPCRDEWLLLYAADLSTATRDWRITRVTPVGELVGNDKLDSFVNVDLFLAGLAPVESTVCGSESQLILGYRESGATTRLRRWAIDVESGALRRDGAELDLKHDADVVHAAFVGSKLFVAGVGEKPMLWEVQFDAAAELRLRKLDLLADNSARPGSVLSSGTPMYFNSNAAMGPLANGLLVAFPNGFDESSNLATHRRPDDTKTPVAMSRLIGCTP